MKGTSWRWGLVMACAGAALLLLGVITGRWPAGHLTLLRGVLFGGTLCLMVLASAEGSPGWAVLVGLTAFLLNPFMPIRMRRADWRLLAISTTVLLTAAAVRFGRTGH